MKQQDPEHFKEFTNLALGLLSKGNFKLFTSEKPILKMQALREALGARNLFEAAKQIVALRKEGSPREISKLVKKTLGKSLEAESYEAIDFVCTIVGCSTLSLFDPLSRCTSLFPCLIWIFFYVDFFTGDIESDLRMVDLLLCNSKTDHVTYAQAFGVERFQHAKEILEQREANPAHRVQVVIRPQPSCYDPEGVCWTARFPNGIAEKTGVSSTNSWALRDSERTIRQMIGVAEDVVIDYINE